MSSSSWKSILVAVRDPAARGQIAIRKAARIAMRSGSRITLFHAFAMPLPLPQAMPSDANAILRMAMKQRREQLLKLARPLKAQGLKVQCEAVWDFPPAHAIVRRVLDSRPDLLVAESHRHSRLARRFLTNSDWELIRECPCPVWFVKQERLANTALILAAIDPTHARAKPSGLDGELLGAATRVRQQLGGRIALVHVEDTTSGRHWFATRAASVRKAAGVQAVTAETVERLAQRNDVAPVATVLRAGIPADELVASAARLKADLLVMGAVSRSGLSPSHIGNTAEAVIEGVTCDVLVVKPRRFRTGVPNRRPKLLVEPA